MFLLEFHKFLLDWFLDDKTYCNCFATYSFSFRSKVGFLFAIKLLYMTVRPFHTTSIRSPHATLVQIDGGPAQQKWNESEEKRMQRSVHQLLRVTNGREEWLNIRNIVNRADTRLNGLRARVGQCRCTISCSFTAIDYIIVLISRWDRMFVFVRISEETIFSSMPSLSRILHFVLDFNTYLHFQRPYSEMNRIKNRGFRLITKRRSLLK